MATDTKRRRITPVAMVLHLDEEEEVDEDAEETWEEEGCGDDEKQFAPAAADDDRGEARNRESVAIDVEGRVGGVSDLSLIHI